MPRQVPGEPLFLFWDERALYTSWYVNHASSGHCNICDVDWPCRQWAEAKEKLSAAGMLDRHGHVRAPVRRPVSPVDEPDTRKGGSG
jgi:hypothetical protein